jgi:hypothetical protein
MGRGVSLGSLRRMSGYTRGEEREDEEPRMN